MELFKETIKFYEIYLLEKEFHRDKMYLTKNEWMQISN